MNLQAYDIETIRANAQELLAQGHDRQMVEIILSNAARSAFKIAHPDKVLPKHLQPGHVRETIWGLENGA